VWPEAATKQLLLRCTGAAEVKDGPSGRRRALSRIRKFWSLLCPSFGRGERGDLRPAFAQADCFIQSIKELLLAVIVPPASAVLQFEEVLATALGEYAPPVRDLLECMEG
jgi:hypothetical protein